MGLLLVSIAGLIVFPERLELFNNLFAVFHQALERPVEH